MSVADASTAQMEPTGVLLVNLGSPAAPTYGAVRKYLAEFLSDRRVVRAPRLVWLPVLYLFILTFRPRRTARNYAKVWRNDVNLSPLVHITQRQAKALQAKFDAGAAPVKVSFAMRYGAPSIGAELQALAQAGCKKVLVLPMYPQDSTTTVASVVDKVEEERRGLFDSDALRYAAPYYAHPAYIEALAQSIKPVVRAASASPDALVLSFHGLPQSYDADGDPYRGHCEETARLLRELLDLGDLPILTTYQSRFGPAKWLEPYTDKVIAELAQKGARRVLLAAPGFAADCIETLEELDLGLRDTFIENGGEWFERVPCLNDSPGGIEMLHRLVLEELGAWKK